MSIYACFSYILIYTICKTLQPLSVSVLLHEYIKARICVVIFVSAQLHYYRIIFIIFSKLFLIKEVYYYVYVTKRNMHTHIMIKLSK